MEMRHSSGAVEPGNPVHPATADRQYGTEEAEALWLAHFGRPARARKIASELDAVFRMSDADEGGDNLLRISDNGDRVADLQVAVLEHISASAPALPIPHVRRSGSGASVIALQAIGNARHAAFATTFLPGKPLATLRSLSQRNRLFNLLARLDRSLEGFSHPSARRSLLWDVSNADRAAPMASAIAAAPLRDLAERALEDWRARAAPALAGLRRQIIHNDFNPSNILATDDGEISGIIDFGDVVEAPLVCELATAIAYQEPQHGFEALLATSVAAYGEINPLTDEEIAVLPILVRARAAMVVAITHWRASRDPGNRAYLLRNVPLAAGLLESAARSSSRVSRPL